MNTQNNLYFCSLVFWRSNLKKISKTQHISKNSPSYGKLTGPRRFEGKGNTNWECDVPNMAFEAMSLTFLPSHIVIVKIQK